MATTDFQFDLSKLGELGQQKMNDRTDHSVREFLFAELRHGECVTFHELLETLYGEGWKREELEGIIAFLSYRFHVLHAEGKIDPVMTVALLTSASIPVPADYDAGQDSLRQFTPTDRLKRNVNYLIKLYNRGGFLEFTRKVDGDLKEHVLLEADREVLKLCIEPAVMKGGKINKSLLELACQALHCVSLAGRSEVKLKDLTKDLFNSWRLAEASENPPVAQKPIPKPELARRKAGPAVTAFGSELHRLIGCVVGLLEEKQIAWPKGVMVGWTARKLAEAMGASANDPVIAEALTGLVGMGLEKLCQLTPFQSVYRWQAVEWGVIAPTSRHIRVLNDVKIQQFVDAMVRDTRALQSTRLHVAASVPDLIPVRPESVKATVVAVIEEVLVEPVPVASEVLEKIIAPKKVETMSALILTVEAGGVESPVVYGTPVAVEAHRVAGLLLAMLEKNGWPVGVLIGTALGEIVSLILPDCKQPVVVVNTDLLSHGFSRLYMRCGKPSIFRREVVMVDSTGSMARQISRRVTDEEVRDLAIAIIMDRVREIAYIERCTPQVMTSSVSVVVEAEPVVEAQLVAAEPLVMEAALVPVHFDPPAVPVIDAETPVVAATAQPTSTVEVQVPGLEELSAVFQRLLRGQRIKAGDTTSQRHQALEEVAMSLESKRREVQELENKLAILKREQETETERLGHIVALLEMS